MNRHERRRAKALEQRRTGYMHRLLAAYANGSIPITPGVSHIVVQHDSWCGIYQGRCCNCVPDISAPGPDAVIVIDEHGVGTKAQRS